MAERKKLDAPPPEPDGADQEDLRTAQRGRSESVIAFGVVALVAMAFGFFLGLMF